MVYVVVLCSSKMETWRCISDINAGDIPADMRLNGISALIRRLYNSEYEQEMHELMNATLRYLLVSEVMKAVHVMGCMRESRKLMSLLENQIVGFDSRRNDT